MASPARDFTIGAMQAMDFATLFNLTFSARLPGAVPWRIELTMPVGPSTDGGKHALQHLRLVPEGGGSATVIGATSQVTKRTEIRSLELLRELHAQRFKGADLPLDGDAYEDLLRRLQRFFSGQGHAVTTLDAIEPAPSAPPSLARGGVSGGVVAALVMAAIVSAAIAVALLMR